MSVMSKNTIAVPDSRIDSENMSQLVVRINGTLPDLSIMGDEEKSERAAEVKRMEIARQYILFCIYNKSFRWC